MNKTEKNFNVNSLPISKKAYLRLVARIDKAFEFYHKESVPNAVMIAVLNRYLIGDVEVIDQLPPALFIAFQFVMQDADMAMERSRKARERARLRREARIAKTSETAKSEEPTEVFPEPIDTIGSTENPEVVETVDTPRSVAPVEYDNTEAHALADSAAPGRHNKRVHNAHTPPSQHRKRYTPSSKRKPKFRKVKIHNIKSLKKHLPPTTIQ